MTSRKQPVIALRRDAQERRERLIRAAAELYGSDGFGVPLEKIADRAGIGRGTLYRNFADREALLVAVLQVYLDELATKVAQWGDRNDAFYLTICTLANRMITRNGFQEIGPMHRQAPAVILRFRAGVESILAEPLVRAKAAGLIREDFEIGDVYLLILMVGAGGLDDNAGVDATARVERACQLLVRGLAPHSPSSGA
jgi:AcrR family transcriptional regulator